MRSARPSACQLRRRGPTQGLLPAVAGIVDQATLAEPGHVLVHIDGPVHPDVTPGAQAPRGRRAPVRGARRLHGARIVDRLRHPRPGPRSPPRRSRGAAPADGGHVPRRPSGRGGIACCVWAMSSASHPARRSARSPTSLGACSASPRTPAPESTCLLWTSMWLDRVLERWGQPHRRRDLTSSWGQIAVLHPAIHAPSPPDVVAFADPASLVTVARSHAAATSWEQLRRSPVPLALPGGALDRVRRRCGWTTASSPDGRSAPSPRHRDDGRRPAGAARRPPGSSAARDDGGLARVTARRAQPSAPAARSAAIRSSS